MKNNKNQKPLTLEGLVSYNREVLFPWMQGNFVTKTEFKGLEIKVGGLETEFKGFKGEFKDFKNKTLTSQDIMLKKLDILLTEKTVREHQEKREKKMWAIIIKALQEHRILSGRQLEEIAQLEIF